MQYRLNVEERSKEKANGKLTGKLSEIKNEKRFYFMQKTLITQRSRHVRAAPLKNVLGFLF